MAKLVLSLCLMALICAAHSAPMSTKVNFSLRHSLESNTRVNILVTMKDSTQAALEQVNRGIYATRGARAQAVYDSLNALAKESQKNVLSMLESPRFFAITVKSFWISNQVYIQGADAYLINSLAEMDDVAAIDEEEIVYLVEPAQNDDDVIVRAEWGVEKIRAPEAWAASGSTGAGAVVAVVDTGVRHTHQELRAQYQNDAHSWYNPYASQANPTDGHGHGTHCSGTVLGSSGLGVAPGAALIACKGLRDDGSGTNAGLLDCAQFVTCPHDYQGNNPDCSKVPDVSSNSWGGGSGNNWYDSSIAAWNAAGIVPVFANGNSGPSCTSAISPGDTTALIIAVGATQTTDAIASFSSRGPSSRGIMKPDVSAPGVNVVSAGHTSDTGRATMSGTSMATPHVAGLCALLRSVRPNLTVSDIRGILERTAVAGTSGSQTCGGTPDTAIPNNTFGYGRVDALNAVNAALKM